MRQDEDKEAFAGFLAYLRGEGPPPKERKATGGYIALNMDPDIKTALAHGNHHPLQG